MHFLRPEFLFLLALPPLWAAAAFALRRRRARRLAALGPRAAATARAGGRFAAQVLLAAVGLSLGAAALARPWWGEREEQVESAVRNVLVLLDVSRSMLAEDVRPSRLGRAKADLADLAAGLRGDRAALVAFRAGAVTLCPFTTDVSFLLEAIEGASLDSAPRGETDLGGALAHAREALAALGPGHGAVILVSDGEDLSGRAVEEAKKCGEEGVPVFCVGVGGTRGADVPADDAGTPLSHRGEKVVSKLDNATLVAVANASGGVYLPLASMSGAATLGAIYRDHVRRVVREETRASRESRRIERYPLFLLPGLLCLLAAAALSRGRPLRAPRPAAAAALLAIFALPAPASDSSPASTNEAVPTVSTASTVSPAPTARALAREAQRAADGGDPAAALALYREAIAAPADPDPTLAPRLLRNAALAALAAGDNKEAAERFAALGTGDADAAAGLGLALYRLSEATTSDSTNLAERARVAKEKLDTMERSAAAFRDALRARPTDGAARTNLAAAVRGLPALRDEAARAERLARFHGKDFQEVLGGLLRDQRAAYARAARAFADPSAERIVGLEGAAADERRAAEAWEPVLEELRAHLLPAFTNEDERATFERNFVETADAAAASADAMEALDPEALALLRRADNGTFALVASLADPLRKLDLAIESQSNALARAADPARIRTPREEQGTAMATFEGFSEDLGPWLEENPLPSAADDLAAPPDAAPMFDEVAEVPPNAAAPAPDRKQEILALSDEVRGTFEVLRMNLGAPGDTLPETVLPDARAAHEKMVRIRELLNPPQQQQQQQQQDQGAQQDRQDGQDGRDQGAQHDKQDGRDGRDQQEAQEEPQEAQEEPQEAQEEPQDEREGQAAEAAEEEKDDDEEADEALLARILEAEKRRADERRHRQHDLPPRPGVRDW